VCRNSGDTEGCRESVMRQSRWRERLGSRIGVLRQEWDTDPRYQRCRGVRDTDAEECGTERAGCQYQESDANMRREGMPIQGEKGCQGQGV
jgi:hypothetical protein